MRGDTAPHTTTKAPDRSGAFVEEQSLRPCEGEAIFVLVALERLDEGREHLVDVTLSLIHI